MCSSFLLTAAGSKESQGAQSDSKVTLTVFHYLDKADGNAVKSFERMKTMFAQQYPDIMLQWEFLTNEPYHNKLQAMSVSDQLPDLMYLWPGKRTGQVTSNAKVKDLRPWLKGHENEFLPATLASQGDNGEIWELPQTLTATHVMFVNTKLLKELGLSMAKTFDELIAQGNTIRKAGYIPIAMDNKDGWEMQSCLLSVLVERTGGKEWILKAARGEASFQDIEFVNALEVIDTLSRNKMFSPGINQAEYGRALSDFVNQKAVYFIDGGWRTSSLVSELDPSLYDAIEFSVIPDLPSQKGQSCSSSIVAGTGFGMNAKLSMEKANAAWKWIWFYSGMEGSKIRQEQGMLTSYKLPPKESLPLLQKKLSLFLENTPGGYVIDAVLDAEAMGILQPLLQEMMFGNITPQDAAKKFEEYIAQNFRKK